VTYETKEEAQDAFRQLLSDKKVSADWNWDRVRRVVNKDPRYEALKREGERKQVFNAWKPIRRREQQDAERAAGKVKLTKLKALMMIVDEIGADSTYRQAAEILRSHE
jgi:pre-mRNA-processing factor 40